MLNSKQERELCYIVQIDDVKPIAGKDRVECAVVGGWTIMVQKGQFKPGDLGIYFEIDSKVPEKEPFLFLAPKHFKIKTQKYKTPDGPFWSQGLLMSAEDFGWKLLDDCICDNKNRLLFAYGDERFLTKQLGVTYSVESDNKRKAKSPDKYAKMAQRHPKVFSKKPIRWLMKHKWGKVLLFIFFGKQKDKKNGWPAWVKKTDEERIQNMPWILKDKKEWIATEKIDGTSTTFTLQRKNGKIRDFYVCSRNVVFDTPEKADKCFYETNVYLEMADKYKIKEALENFLIRRPDLEWVTIQGETYGAGIQKRQYGLKTEHRFAAFNLITSKEGRLNSVVAKDVLENEYNIPFVPIVDEHFILPDTVEEMLELASGRSALDGGMREGLVLRSQDGAQSFKAVSNDFLLKYHSN